MTLEAQNKIEAPVPFDQLPVGQQGIYLLSGVEQKDLLLVPPHVNHHRVLNSYGEMFLQMFAKLQSWPPGLLSDGNLPDLSHLDIHGEKVLHDNPILREWGEAFFGEPARGIQIPADRRSLAMSGVGHYNGPSRHLGLIWKYGGKYPNRALVISGHPKYWKLNAEIHQTRTRLDEQLMFSVDSPYRFVRYRFDGQKWLASQYPQIW